MWQTRGWKGSVFPQRSESDSITYGSQMSLRPSRSRQSSRIPSCIGLRCSHRILQPASDGSERDTRQSMIDVDSRGVPATDGLAIVPRQQAMLPDVRTGRVPVSYTHLRAHETDS